MSKSTRVCPADADVVEDYQYEIPLNCLPNIQQLISECPKLAAC